MKQVLRVLLIACVLGTAMPLAARSILFFPTAWAKDKDKEFATGLDENLQMLYGKIKGADAVGMDDASSDIAKAAKKCGGKVACVERAAKDQTDFDLAILLSFGKGRIEATIFNKKGRKVAEGAVDVEEDSDPEDMAGAVLGTVNKLLSKIGDESESDSGGDDEFSGGKEDRSSKASELAKKLSSSEKKEVMRAGFKAYQGGDHAKAADSFRQADEMDLTDAANEIKKLTGKAREAVQSEDWAAALDNLDRASEQDDKIRAAGYKAIVYTKESNERWKFKEGEDDGSNFRKLFKNFKGEIGDHKKWREEQLRKLEEELGALAKLKDTLTRKFESDEKDFRRKEKDYEDKNAAGIDGARKDLEGGLDEKYEKKIKQIDGKITRKGEEYANDKGHEEVYRDAIEQDMKALDKKYKDLAKQAERDKKEAAKQQETASKRLEKETEKQIAELEASSKNTEKRIAAMNKEIERDSEKFDKAENKLQQEHDGGLGKDEAQDRKDIETVEKEMQKKLEDLNAQAASFDKREEELSKKLETVQQELDQFMEKQEKRLSKVQEKVDKEREKIDQDADAKRRKAEEDADKEYEQKAQRLQKDVESVESEMRKFEEKYNNYEKKTDYKDLQKKLAAANKTLQSFEKGRESFVKGKVAPIEKEIDSLNKGLEKSFRETKKKIDDETAAFRAKKESEKKDVERSLATVSKSRKDFQKKFDASQKSIESERAKKVKGIEGRQKAREEQWAADAKKRRAAFEQELDKKRKQLSALEKQMGDAAKQGDKLRDSLAKKLDQIKLDGEKKLQNLEEASVKRAQQMEVQQEKDRQAIHAKYENLYKQDRAKLEKEMKDLEVQMKNLVKERDAEQVRLKATIEKLEKDIIEKRDQWAKAAKQRQSTFDAELAKAGAKEATAKKEYKKRKDQIERDFLTKLDGTAKKMIDKSAVTAKKEYEIERSRDVEATGVTKEINNLRITVYVKRAISKVKDGDFKEARKLLYKAAYFNKESLDVKAGFAEMQKGLAALFAEASRLMTDDPDRAKEILRKLTGTLPSSDEYYIKAKFLLLDEE